jgi:hypothetical protein
LAGAGHDCSVAARTAAAAAGEKGVPTFDAPTVTAARKAANSTSTAEINKTAYTPMRTAITAGGVTRAFTAFTPAFVSRAAASASTAALARTARTCRIIGAACGYVPASACATVCLRRRGASNQSANQGNTRQQHGGRNDQRRGRQKSGYAAIDLPARNNGPAGLERYKITQWKLPSAQMTTLKNSVRLCDDGCAPLSGVEWN